MTNLFYSKRILISLFALLLLPEITYADNIGSTKISYASGRRSQTDGIEDRDLSGNYKFYKYGLNIKAELPTDTNYGFSYSNYEKDFEASYNNLDNITNLFNGYFLIPVHKTDRAFLRFRPEYRLRTKRYKNSPSSEYDENSLSAALDFDFDKKYSIAFSGGMQDYDYIKKSSSSQDKYFFKVEPAVKFLNDDAKVWGYYKRDWVDQAKGKKDYTQDSFSLKTDLKLKTPLIYKVGAGFSYGRNDTRDSDEDREDSLRFEYRLWDVTANLKTTKMADHKLTYGQTDRKYFTSINGYDNWFIKDRSTFNLLKKEPFNLDLVGAFEHRETKFFQNEALSYHKNSFAGGFDILKRENYSFTPEFRYTNYKYPPLSTKNQKSYKLMFDAKKYLGSTDNALEAFYSYDWKRYKYATNIEQWTLNLSLTVKF